MKYQLSKILVFLFIIRMLMSCDATKRVGENEQLLQENNVFINEKKDNTEAINSLIYQKPNTRILSIPLGLHFYNLARPNRDSLYNAWLNKTPKRKERLTNRYSQKQLDRLEETVLGFNEWLKTTGEAPVIVDDKKISKSKQRLIDYHVNNGWFDAETTHNIDTTQAKRAKVEYYVNTGPAYTLDTITEHIKSPKIDTLYKNIKKESLLKQGEQYRTDNFQQERNRIAANLRNSGIYHFSSEYISFEIDTIGTNEKVNVDIQIQDRAIRTPDSIIREPFKVYTIKDVNIITDYSFEKKGQLFQDSVSYNGYNIYSYGKLKYRPKAIADAIFINPGTIFKDLDRTRTYKHLNELRTFRYPSIEYSEHPDNTLTDTIRLTPLKKFSLTFGTDVSQSNIQTVGFSLNSGLLVRNVFKGAETFQISALGSIGSSKDKNDPADPFFDINEFGIDLKLTIPRLFSPFYTEGIIPKYMSPSTRISLASTSQTNIGLDKQTLTGNFNYNWYPNDQVTNRLDLFNIQYVRNLNPEAYFDVYQDSYDELNQIAKDVGYISEDEDLSIENPNETDEFIDYILDPNTPPGVSDDQVREVNGINEQKTRLTENNLIVSSSFNFIHDTRKNLYDEDFSIFRAKLETAGNILSAASNLFGLDKRDDGRYELFNVAYSQYIKTEFDYTKHWDLGRKNIFAVRGFFGIAIPYGNSNSIPFNKSFFAGGPNDNRAWAAYSLGPGSSETKNEFNEANLKITFNAEQRFNIFDNLNGAIFLDAGNIWNIWDNVENEKATFSGFDSLEDIALGSGFGLRYDFSFLVFRFDIGFKTYDPVYGDENRWFNDYNFSKAVYNIGINYPF